MNHRISKKVPLRSLSGQKKVLFFFLNKKRSRNNTVKYLVIAFHLVNTHPKIATSGPIITTLGMDLEWHPGQVLEGMEVTLLNQNINDITDEKPTISVCLCMFGVGVQTSDPNVTKFGNTHTHTHFVIMDLPLPPCSITYRNINWFDRSESVKREG